jgi:hypothetical protein
MMAACPLPSEQIRNGVVAVRKVLAINVHHLGNYPREIEQRKVAKQTFASIEGSASI